MFKAPNRCAKRLWEDARAMPTNDGIYGCFTDSAYGFFLIQPVAFSLINLISGKGVMRAAKW